MAGLSEAGRDFRTNASDAAALLDALSVIVGSETLPPSAELLIGYVFRLAHEAGERSARTAHGLLVEEIVEEQQLDEGSDAAVEEQRA